jgi:membrane-bound metal-dependent hydrolase YbcI (DUF457 family)
LKATYIWSEKAKALVESNICNMPFTPYHIGPGLFLGLLFLRFIDFPTFLLASVIVDVEPFLVLFFNLNYPLHGFFHSLLGGTLVATSLALVMLKTRDKLSPLMAYFELEQKVSFKSILLASLSRIYIHILLDSRMYTDIQPFYPSPYNPLLTTGILAGLDSYVICVWSFFGVVIIYIIRLFLIRREEIN